VTPRRAALLASLLTLVILLPLFWFLRSRASAPAPSESAASTAANDQASAHDRSPTVIYAHNLRLLKGPNFRVYVRWIRGQMLRTHPHVNPSFDEPDSFVLDIQKGVVHANIGDISNYLNTSSPAGAPLKNISIQPDGDQLKIHGTLHKIVPLPIEMVGTLSPTPQGLVRFHVSKISVIKIPMKGLLGTFHVELSDLVHTTNVPGITLADNDVLFDTQQLLPAPHIRGQITSVTVRPPDVEVIYGNAPNDEAKLAQWRNFLRLTGGSLDFGKLTMHNVDLTMIDVTQDPWFTLDLVNYQFQIVNGTTRMTADAGLQIFMPDLDEKTPKPAREISVQWLKNRNASLPPDVPAK
jgi:hypothetical protein